MKVSAEVLDDMINSNIEQNAQPFKYPVIPAGSLLWLDGIISDEEMCHLNTALNEGCSDNISLRIMVISGMTIIRKNPNP